MRNAVRWSAVCLGLGWLVWPGTLRGDLPAPRMDRIALLGAAAGASVEVQFAGADDEDAVRLWFDHPGIAAEHVEGRKFKVTVAADVPAGTYDVRFVGRYGASSPRLFHVQHGLAEQAEQEPNNVPTEAQVVAVNGVVNAVSDNNEADLYRFAARQGARIVIDCLAGRLDSPMDAVLSLAGADGRILATSGDHFGRDPMIDFLVPADGEYLLTVNDLSYRGGFPYRLILSDRPAVEFVHPRVMTAGQSAELAFVGRNLPEGKTSPWRVNDLPLVQKFFAVEAPADVLARGEFRFREHPTDHSVLPTACTITMHGFQAEPPWGLLGATRFPAVVVGQEPVVVEAEPNDTADQAQAIPTAAAVSGHFDQPRDLDWYQFNSGPGGPFGFQVYCERIGGRADAYLVVADEKGNQVAELDDFGHRVNAFDGHLRDPLGTVNLQPNQTYRVLVADRYSRGGGRYQYVLSVRPAQPDFFVAAMHRHNPGPAGLNLWRGGAEWLDIVIHRLEGHSGPITLTAEGLPPGVHAAETTIHDSSRGTLVLWADHDAPEAVSAIRIVAKGHRGETALVRSVRPYTRVWNQANLSSSRPVRQLTLAVCQPAPLRVMLEPAEIEVESGSAARLVARVQRHWPEATNEVRLAPLMFQGNFQMAEAVVPAAAGEVGFEIRVQPNTAPGRYTMAVQCQSQVPFAKDPQAAQKPNNLVTFPSLPVTLVVRPPAAK